MAVQIRGGFCITIVVMLIQLSIDQTFLRHVIAEEPLPARRAAWTTSTISGTPDPPPPYRVVPAFPELKFESPLDLTVVPGTNLLCVAEQGGKLFTFENQATTASKQLMADLKLAIPELTAVYAVTFHPQFEQNGRVYVCYVKANDQPDGTFVSEFNTENTSGLRLVPETERVIIRWWSGGHNGCCLKFGPDGFLYISTGDGGAPSPPDPLMAGQDVSNLLSNILRIDVNQYSQDRGYSVPSDNPFVGMEGVRPEIWAFGFRNPWRMSFDRQRGDLWVGDVGWQRWEMVYRIERGGNYGWPIMEGPQPAAPEVQRGPAPILPPTVSHPHSEAASITGGFVYYGTEFPELTGTYIYGDFQSGKVWGLKHDGKAVTWQQELAHTPLQLVGFAEDQSGELLLIDYQRSHQIFRFAKNLTERKSGEFPRLLSRTGLFQNVKDQVPASGVRPYQINVQQWADHATSQRWVAVPGDEPVQFEAPDRWKLPDGSVLVKTISIELERGKPESARRLETQVLHREDGTWRPYTYLWNEAQTDAELVPVSGTMRVFEVRDPAVSGGVEEVRWRVSSRGECQMCHNPWVEMKTTTNGIQSASPLAFSFAQLNVGPQLHDDSEKQDKNSGQLDSLVKEGWIAGISPELCRTGPRFADPYTPQETLTPGEDLNARARAWLHVNCSHCHQPHAGGTALIELTSDVELEKMQLVGARPGQGSFGITNAGLLVPGNPYASVLHYRIAKSGGGRMPRLGSELTDLRAVRLIHDWIESMPESGNSNQRPADRPVLLNTLNSAEKEQRTEIVQSLMTNVEDAQRLVHWLIRHPEAVAARTTIVEEAVKHPVPEVRDLFETWFPPERKLKRLGSNFDPAHLLAIPGDSERGRLLFEKDAAVACRTCHKAGSIGEDVGPDLRSVGRKYTRDELLTHLMEPSRFIDPKYVTHVVELKSGQVVSGLLTEQTDTVVVLRNAQQKRIEIPTEEIETRVTQQKSLMPDLILRDLTAEQASDLIAWLSTLREP
ncbi:MAG: PQQ-dependent sugar dehydrogenase [Planctomyces sp.]|nr:PQQ-dependent sugar dehydrogenase [Planctomyces sp.]